MKEKKFWILAALFLAVFLLSCCVGRYPLSFRDLWEICRNPASDEMKANIFFKVRLSRTFFVAISGSALAASGLVYQTIFQNPLVAPDVLGVSGGASVGAVAAILMGGGGVLISCFSFAGGLLTVGMTIFMARCIGGQKNFSLLISGIITGSLANAALMAMKYLADPNKQLPAIDYWLMGSFHSVRWEDVFFLAPVGLLCLFLLWLLRWKLHLLTLGDEDAKSLGVAAGPLRLVSILLSTLLVAAVVSITGIISWIGLIVPHMVSLFFPGGILKNYSLCILLGASLTLAADMLARSLSAAEIPISILTSLMGACFLFVILILRRRKGGSVY